MPFGSSFPSPPPPLKRAILFGLARLRSSNCAREHLFHFGAPAAMVLNANFGARRTVRRRALTAEGSVSLGSKQHIGDLRKNSDGSRRPTRSD